MRKELFDDCAGQGGCCSRGCGCCSQRQLSKKEKARDHCTAEYWCCSNRRSFELPEKKEQEQERTEALATRPTSDNRAYLLKSANSFLYSPNPPPSPKLPTPQDTEKLKSRWRQIFGDFCRWERLIRMSCSICYIKFNQSLPLYPITQFLHLKRCFFPQSD